MEKREGYKGLRDTAPMGSMGAVETDEELKIRLGYVIGATRELVTARGDQLDAIADRHGLRRRHGVFYRSDGFNYGIKYAVSIDPGGGEVTAYSYLSITEPTRVFSMGESKEKRIRQMNYDLVNKPIRFRYEKY